MKPYGYDNFYLIQLYGLLRVPGMLRRLLMRFLCAFYLPLMSDGVVGITVLLSVSPFHNALAFMPLLQLVADY